MEAAEQAHDHLKNASLEDYYDTILLKGLRLAEVDNRLGHLNEERLDRIVATVGELVTDLETHHDVEATNVTTSDVGSNLGALVAIEQTNDKPVLAGKNGDRRVLFYASPDLLNSTRQRRWFLLK